MIVLLPPSPPEERPVPPPGYRYLEGDETPAVDDLFYDCFALQWTEIIPGVLEIALILGGPKMFPVTPVRRIVHSDAGPEAPPAGAATTPAAAGEGEG